MVPLRPRRACHEWTLKLAPQRQCQCPLLPRLDQDLIPPIPFQRMPPMNQEAFMWVCWIGSLLSSILGTAAAGEGAGGNRVSKHFRHLHLLQMSCSKRTCPWARSRRKATRRTLPLALESGQGRKQRYCHPSLRAARLMRAASAVLFRQEDELGRMHQKKHHQVLLTMPRDHHPRGPACLPSTKSTIRSSHSSRGLQRAFAFCTIGIPTYI